jgi:hypothetical protein
MDVVIRLPPPAAGGTLYDDDMTNDELFAGTAVKNWTLVIDRLNGTIAALSDDAMQQEVSPGRNRVYYVIGHLTAVHDRLFPLLSLGERLYPELDDQFIAKPDRAVPETVSSADLRKAFAEVNTKLTAAIEALPPADWLKKHAAVSDEDFAKEPLRNRIAVLQSRTAHASFHEGQIRLTRER